MLGPEGDGGVRRSSHDSHGDISVVGRGDHQASMRSRNTVDAMPCVGSAAIPHAVASALLSASREHAAEVVSCLLGFGQAEDSSLLFRLRYPLCISSDTRGEGARVLPWARAKGSSLPLTSPAGQFFTPRSRIATVRWERWPHHRAGASASHRFQFVERVVVQLRAVGLAVVALPDGGVRWLSLRISAISATARKSLTTERLVQGCAALLVSGADEPSD